MLTFKLTLFFLSACESPEFPGGAVGQSQYALSRHKYIIRAGMSCARHALNNSSEHLPSRAALPWCNRHTQDPVTAPNARAATSRRASKGLLEL